MRDAVMTSSDAEPDRHSPVRAAEARLAAAAAGRCNDDDDQADGGGGTPDTHRTHVADRPTEPRAAVAEPDGARPGEAPAGTAAQRQHGGAPAGQLYRRAVSPPSERPGRGVVDLSGWEEGGGEAAGAPSNAGRAALPPQTLAAARLAAENARLRAAVARLAEGVAVSQRAAVSVAAAAGAAIGRSAGGGGPGSAGGGATVVLPLGVVRALALASDGPWCASFVASDAASLIAEAVRERRRLCRVRTRLGWAAMRDAASLFARAAELRRRGDPAPDDAPPDDVIVVGGRVAEARRRAAAAEAAAANAAASEAAARWCEVRGRSLLRLASLKRRFLSARADAAERGARASLGVALFAAASASMSDAAAAGIAEAAAGSAGAARKQSRIAERPVTAADRAASWLAEPGAERPGAMLRLAAPLSGASPFSEDHHSASGGLPPLGRGRRGAGAGPAVGGRRGAGSAGLRFVPHGGSVVSLAGPPAGDGDPRRAAMAGAMAAFAPDAVMHAASVVAPSAAERALVVLVRHWRPPTSPLRVASQARLVRDRLLAAADAMAADGASRREPAGEPARGGVGILEDAARRAGETIGRGTSAGEEDRRWARLARTRGGAALLELLVFALTGAPAALL